ncbi:MAG: DegV family EDD domain-containing protein [Spirochaetales bacterium]|nr:DegV family EDD domain-containing protein [Spirochaetales bacterium]
MTGSGIKELRSINGTVVYNSFLSGYEKLAAERVHLDAINVFPVPDGDTGSNMVSTLYTAIREPPSSHSLSGTLGQIADRALSGARGNSGIILAQFLNGLAEACPDEAAMSTIEFAEALKKAAAGTRNAVENPREGTLITLLDVWTGEMYRLSHAIGDFKDLFLGSMERAREALAETRDMLEELRSARVVDAGASGFVSFLEGIALMIASGVVPSRPEAEPMAFESTGDEHVVSPENIAHRYCTEALIRRPAGGEAFPEHLHEALKEMGDSLIISNGRERTRIHIHTNDPSALFLTLRGYGKIEEQKVDDMKHQYNCVHRPVSRIAVVTDSIADIPGDLADQYQIHVIPQKIRWGEDEYLDRVTITSRTMLPYLDASPDYPGSSAPDPARVNQVFSWLSSHYDSVIAVPVAKAQSATWQVMSSAAREFKKKGFTIDVVDSRLNSAAQGLAVLSAARDAAEGIPHDEILKRLEKTIENAKIYVSVATFKYMVRGGRVSALKGLIAALTRLKPVVSLDAAGKGVAWGASFSADGSAAKILKEAKTSKSGIRRWDVVHAAAPERAADMAEKMSSVLGTEPEYVMEISPIVALHAGIGAVAVAWI